jgi:hypothetical protein
LIKGPGRCKPTLSDAGFRGFWGFWARHQLGYADHVKVRVCRTFSRRLVRRICDTDRIGRPSKLTDDPESAILDALRAGNYLETGAAAVGVAASTLYKWRAEFSGILEAAERARAEAENQARVRPDPLTPATTDTYGGLGGRRSISAGSLASR